MAKLPVSPVKPHRNKVRGILPDKRRVPHGWPACLRRQPPRVAFRNNDIYLDDCRQSSMSVHVHCLRNEQCTCAYDLNKQDGCQ